MENWFVIGALMALLGSSGCGVATMRGANLSKATQEILKEEIGESSEGPVGILYADFTYSDFERKRQRGRMLQSSADVWTARHVSGELIFQLSHSVANAQISGAGVFSGVSVEVRGTTIRVLPDLSMLDRLAGTTCLQLTLNNGTQLRWTIQYSAGDFNIDGVVDDADARDMMWALGGQSITSEFHSAFDLKADGRINSTDLDFFYSAYNAMIPDLSGGCKE